MHVCDSEVTAAKQISIMMCVCGYHELVVSS